MPASKRLTGRLRPLLSKFRVYWCPGCREYFARIDTKDNEGKECANGPHYRVKGDLVEMGPCRMMARLLNYLDSLVNRPQ